MMLNDRKYKQIVNEWFARLEKGYAQPPYTKHELKVLDEVMRKHNLKLNEAPADFMATPQTFAAYMDQYKDPGQTINGLARLYAAVIDKPEIIKILDAGYSRDLKSTTYTMSSAEKELLDIIEQTIIIKNGHYSELWFSIVYNGKVKGGVAGRSITSDVEVGEIDVSLKNYSMLKAVDFGTLSGNDWETVNDFLTISRLITGTRVNATMTQKSINDQLAELSKPENQKNISDLIELSKTTDIIAVKNLAKHFENILGSENGSDINTIIESFLSSLNRVIASKINQVDYWAIIVNATVYLETKQNIYNALKCDVKSKRLSPAIDQLKGSHLFVRAKEIHKEIVN